MYKLLIVDDEKIEREGMAELINWEAYDIELAGTAWNGQDGYEKVLKFHPDIVMTDIKMPVMDGLGMIGKLKEEFPDIQVIVLSGYGEYEYTSRAMELGIKHYILKPCDEERMLPVIEKVKEEIREKQQEKRKYDTTVKKLLPLAKEQVFRNILLNRETSRKEYDLFLGKMGDHRSGVCLLGFRNPTARFDALEQFVIENVLSELYGEENILMETAINKDVLFLLGNGDIERIEKSVERIRDEFSRVNSQIIQVALSDAGDIELVSTLYTQLRELFQIGSSSDNVVLLHSGRLSGYEGHSAEFFRFEHLKNVKDYADILFEVYLGFMKMNLRGIEAEQKKRICGLVYQVACEEKEEDIEKNFDWESVDSDDVSLIRMLSDLIAELREIDMSSGKEQIRMKQILQAVYENIRNTDLSIRYLAREVLFMNEEHFGRVFVRSWNQKFSTWLRGVRIGLAKEILSYAPETRVSTLAELVGYSPDGQYFSKAFRKETEMTPTEYCEWLRKEKREKQGNL